MDEAFLTVVDGKIYCEEMGESFPCTIEGCREMGRLLADFDYDTWTFSSSLDFTTDFGGDDIDVHKHVHKHIQEGFESFNEGFSKAELFVFTLEMLTGTSDSDQQYAWLSFIFRTDRDVTPKELCKKFNLQYKGSRNFCISKLANESRNNELDIKTL